MSWRHLVLALISVVFGGVFIIPAFANVPLKVKLEAQTRFNTISIQWPQVPKYNFERVEEGFLIKFYDENRLDISEILKVYPTSKSWNADGVAYLMIGSSPNVKFEPSVSGTSTVLTHIPNFSQVVIKLNPR